MLLKKARQLEAEDCPPTTATTEPEMIPRCRVLSRPCRRSKHKSSKEKTEHQIPRRGAEEDMDATIVVSLVIGEEPVQIDSRGRGRNHLTQGRVQPLLKTVRMNPLPWKRSPSQLLLRNRMPGMLRDLSYPLSLSTTIQTQLPGCLAELMKLQLK